MATNHETHDSNCVPECEIVFETDGDKSKARDKLKELYNDCKKNPGHPNFIPVTEFGLEHLPEELRTDKYMRHIKKNIELTVRISVKYTSHNRPDTIEEGKPYPWAEHKDSTNRVRFGTGIVIPFFKPHCTFRGKCPCPWCKRSDNPKMKYWEFIVKTSTHVIYDDSEAECSEFDCFLDTDFCAKYKRLHGLRIDESDHTPDSRIVTDSCYCVCVTHEEDTVDRLHELFRCTVGDLFDPPWMHYPTKAVMVSHPHGFSKRITVGNMLCLTMLIKSKFETNKLLKFDNGTICRLPLKPWTPDLIHSKSWSDEDKYKPFLEAVTEQVFKYRKKLLASDDYVTRRFKTDSKEPESVTEKIYNVLIGSVYDIYRYALKHELVHCIFNSVRFLYRLTTSMTEKRWIRFILSDTKSVELIDIGFLLFRCYLILASNMLEKGFSKETLFFDTRPIILHLFLGNMFHLQPELQPLFDLQQYIIDKTEEYMIQDREYLHSRHAQNVFVKILLAADDIDTYKPGGRSQFNDDIDDGGDDDDSEDFKQFRVQIIGFFFETYRITFYHCYHHFKHLKKSRDLVVGEFLQPGTEFRLPNNSFFILPSDAKFAHRHYHGKPDIFMFPPGTKFCLIIPDTDKYVDFPIPCEAEFMSGGFFDRDNNYYFLNYDIDSCSGSSGASLSLGAGNALFIHKGALDKFNRSVAWQMHNNLRDYEALYNHQDSFKRRLPPIGLIKTKGKIPVPDLPEIMARAQMIMDLKEEAPIIT